MRFAAMRMILDFPLSYRERVSFSLLSIMIAVGLLGSLSGSADAQTLAFSDDAEQAILEDHISSGWKIGSSGISMNQATVHSGLYSWQASQGGSIYHSVSMGFSPVYVVCYIYIPSATGISSGGNTGILCGLLSTSSWKTTGIAVTNSKGALYLTAYTPYGDSLPMGTHPVTTNTWHRIEFAYGPASTVWLDGVQDITGSYTTEAKDQVLIGAING